MYRLLASKCVPLASRLASRNTPIVFASVFPYAHHRSLHLSPREVDHLQLHQAGRLAQYRLARGLKLNLTEATALLSMQLQEDIRDGKLPIASLMTRGQSLLGRRQVMKGVPEMVAV